MAKSILTMLLVFCFATEALAGIYFFTHPDNKTSQLDKQTIKKIYLGKSRNFPNGEPATPVDLPENTDTFRTVLTEIIGKSERKWKAYWSVKIFTGRGTPPKKMATDAEMLQYVKNSPNAIGYIKSQQAPSGVNVVFTISD